MEDAPRTLVQAALEDTEAFAAIVDRHKAMVFSVAYNFFQDTTLAEDLAQDVFLELFRRLRSIESDSHLKFWLRQTITNRCIDHTRWRKTHAHRSLEEAAEPAREPQRSDPLLAAYLRERLMALPDRKRLVVILRFQEDLELEEIARVLKIPVNTVKSTLHRALAILRRRLSPLSEASRYGVTGR